MPSSDPSRSTPLFDQLLTLAPADLPNYRRERRDWLDTGHSISSFADEDRRAIEAIYAAVLKVSQLWQQAQPAEQLKHQILSEFDWAELARRTAQLRDRPQSEKTSSDAARAPRRPTEMSTRETAQDLGQGSINVVFGLVQLLEAIPGDTSLVDKCCAAARDTAKIMRLLLPDLDPETRAMDEANKPHGIDHFTEKWKGMQLATPHGKVEVQLSCTFDGSISARCLETSTIDRMTYALVDNACRYTPEKSIHFFIFPVNPTTTRWVVQHGTSDSGNAGLQVGDLSPDEPADLGVLYRQPVPSNRYGHGLRMVAQLTADCFGLDGIDEAVDRGYVGGKVLEAGPALWFHWPSN